MGTIYRREMKAYFDSPVAYAIMAVFMVMIGLFFWVRNLLYASTDFSAVLSTVSNYLTMIIPVITMKLLADERRNGTEVLLRTAPEYIWKIVVGKYLAAVTMFGIMLGLTLIYPVMLTFMSEDGIPAGKVFSGYVAFFLLGVTYVAIGLLCSSFTDSQVVAAISGIVVLWLLQFVQSIGATVGGKFGAVLQWISPLKRYADFSLGQFNFASLFFYISFSAVIVFITVMNVERRRWN